jgi:large conductance mechanosensitive channel
MTDDIEIIPDSIEKPGRVILGAPKKAFGGFLAFIRERGVMGLAIGFVLGSSVQKVVTAFVNDIVNPFLGIALGRADSIKNFAVGNFLIGDFISVLIDFIILAAIIFLLFKGLGLEKLDKPKE